jgi:hypothetical protein
MASQGWFPIGLSGGLAGILNAKIVKNRSQKNYHACVPLRKDDYLLYLPFKPLFIPLNYFIFPNLYLVSFHANKTNIVYFVQWKIPERLKITRQNIYKDTKP